MSDDLEVLRRRLGRERAARKQAETIAENKSRELYTKAVELEARGAELGTAVGRLELANRALARTEAALRAEHDFTEHLIDTAHVAIAVADHEGRLLRLNQFGQVMAGVAEADALLLRAPEVLAAGAGPDEQGALLRPSEGGRAVTACSAPPRGEHRVIEWWTSALGHDEGGQTGMLLLVGHDVTERVRLFEEVQRLSVTDPLTGLNNRRHFSTLLDSELRRASRYARPLTVVMIDVDYFKKVNDRYGHPVGDRVLVAVARACVAGVRSTDHGARLGGEEFCLLLPETNRAGGAALAERLRGAIAALSFEADGATFAVTASFGVAERGEDEEQESLLARADGALYEAKHGGRNRVVRV